MMADEDFPVKPEGLIFAVEFRLHGMLLLDASPITLPVSRPTMAKIVLSQQNLCGLKTQGDGFFLTVVTRRRPGAEVTDFIESMAREKKFPERKGSTFTTDAQGKLRGSWLTDPTGGPKKYDEFMSNIRQECYDIGSRAISLIRWRIDAAGPQQPFSYYCEMYCSNDGTTFFKIPAPGYELIEIRRDIRLTEQQRNEIIEALQSEAREPFCHKMFREAWSQRFSSPRSALISGVAALEIGVKEAIADLVPNAEWLAINVPSPDVVRILRDFLPMLPTRNRFGQQVQPPGEEVLQLIKQAVTMRNRLAHAGQGEVRISKVHDILCVVRDTLSLLDYYRGQDWALCHISRETLSAIPLAPLLEVEERIAREDALYPETITTSIQLSELPERLD